MLTCLVYVSAARRLFAQDQLAELLENSRANNARIGVTGMLLHVGGNFMQALESEEEIVAGLYRKISADPRHQQPKVILRMPVAERLFGDWSMGFREVSELPAEMRAQVSPFLARSDQGRADPAPGAPDTASPGSSDTIIKLLEGFARNMH